MKIQQAIDLLNEEIRFKKARSVIYSDISPDESNLGGTRDGILNLALCLLKLVDDFDNSNTKTSWDDDISSHLLQLPTEDAFLVGVVIFREHSELIAQLKNCYETTPEVKNSIQADPNFEEPQT